MGDMSLYGSMPTYVEVSGFRPENSDCGYFSNMCEKSSTGLILFYTLSPM